MSENTDYDYLLKLLLIGNTSSEKTSFLLRYTEDASSDSFVASIGIDFVRKNNA